jgi:hypothetical protein
LSRNGFAFVVLFLGMFFVTVEGVEPAWATHDTQHRYTVFGYVRDGQGKPLSDVKVTVTDIPLNQTGTAFTDVSGYYEVLLHLHNENLGDEILIKAQDNEKRAKVGFDPQDHFTERRAEIDFGASAANRPDQGWRYYSYGAAVAVIVGGFISWRLTQKRAKRLRAQSGKKFKQMKKAK